MFGCGVHGGNRLVNINEHRQGDKSISNPGWSTAVPWRAHQEVGTDASRLSDIAQMITHWDKIVGMYMRHGAVGCIYHHSMFTSLPKDR